VKNKIKIVSWIFITQSKDGFRRRENKDGSICSSTYGDVGDAEQEMCGKPPAWYAGPCGGSDPTALEQTSEPIHKQCIRDPVWNGLKNDTGSISRTI